MLYVNVVAFDGTDKVTVSSTPFDSEDWEGNTVIVTLNGFSRQPDANIAAGIVRNVLEAGGAQVTMER